MARSTHDETAKSHEVVVAVSSLCFWRPAVFGRTQPADIGPTEC